MAKEITDFFEACECGDVTTAEDLVRHLDSSNLKEWKTPEGRTCLHAAVMAGNSGLVGELAEKLKEIVKEKDNEGDTALHLAVRKYRVDLVEKLLKFDTELCNYKNKKNETPLKIAVKFGFLEVIKLLIDRTSIDKNENVLHIAVMFNHVKIVNFLTRKKLELCKMLINQAYAPDKSISSDWGNSSDEGISPHKRNSPDEGISPDDGDMPLHTAVRNKDKHMVNLLLEVPGVKKNARDKMRKTPLEIAKELTEYHESLGIIRMLTDYPPRCKPFMYCAPEASHAKRKKATEKIDKAFEERRNSELVTAALLATMTFTAAFTVPGGFNSDRGSPILIDYVSFKLFLIFDCVAFFLSLFACIMWQLSTELTTGDKMLFMTVNGLLVGSSFGFTAFGFIAAMYAMLAHTVMSLAFVLLAITVIITFCGVVTSLYQTVKFSVARARFHRLCGSPRLFDDIVESCWNVAERSGILYMLCRAYKKFHDFIFGDINLRGERAEGRIGGRNGGGNEEEDEHSDNCSCSASPWLNHRGNNV